MDSITVRMKIDNPDAHLASGKKVTQVSWRAYGGEYVDLGVVVAAFDEELDNEAWRFGREALPGWMPEPPAWFLEAAREMGVSW